MAQEAILVPQTVEDFLQYAQAQGRICLSTTAIDILEDLNSVDGEPAIFHYHSWDPPYGVESIFRRIDSRVIAIIKAPPSRLFGKNEKKIDDTLVGTGWRVEKNKAEKEFYPPEFFFSILHRNRLPNRFLGITCTKIDLGRIVPQAKLYFPLKPFYPQELRGEAVADLLYDSIVRKQHPSVYISSDSNKADWEMFLKKNQKKLPPEARSAIERGIKHLEAIKALP